MTDVGRVISRKVVWGCVIKQSEQTTGKKPVSSMPLRSLLQLLPWLSLMLCWDPWSISRWFWCRVRGKDLISCFYVLLLFLCYWRCCLWYKEYIWHCCQKLGSCSYGLVHEPFILLHLSTYLFVYVSSMLFLLLCLCHIIWNQIWWYLLQYSVSP